ncbi:MAG: pyrroloquinoline quinone-dependent dehydrogenase [Bacteroidia bacterium]|nr:pyrroloquinoline quinone-dependent dehydrogenase [Bacteroidia bacterium]
MAVRYIVFVFFLTLGHLSCNRVEEQPVYEGFSWEDNPYFQTWSHYLGDPHRSHFSTLDQINTENVAQLKIAWTYQSKGLDPNSNSQIQNNPMVVGDKLFGVNASNVLFAVKATTGEKLWEFSPENTDESGLGLCRGFAYWPSGSDEESRLFFSAGNFLYAIDIESGIVIPSFGKDGAIDLRENLGRHAEKLPVVMTTPGVIYKNLYIIGFRTSESPGAAPGHIRAYDVHSGELIWIFHTIPYPEEFGYETWPENAYQDPRIGGANNWAGMALDEENSIVYVPTGSSAFDWYGGARIGDNLFANSLIALNADTGERIWHFQFVHHDVWDRDLPAPPNLLDVERDGKKIPAVAQVTKSGHVFVFNRLTGEALFPIEEQPYPQTTLLGDTTAATQPLPLKPVPFARQILNEEDLFRPDAPAFVDDFIDHEQNEKGFSVLDRFNQVTSKGQFIPPDTLGTVLYPGADGGAEWGGAAVDPRDGTMYVNSNEMAWIVRMAEVGSATSGKCLAQIHCARCHGGSLQGLGVIPELQQVHTRLSPEEISQTMVLGKGAMPALPNLTKEEVASISAFLSGMEEETEADHRTEQADGTPYAMVGFGRFKDQNGYPVVKPPWGTLNAIDLNTGEYKWTIPLGHEENLNDPEYPVTGTENYGGPVITAGGVLFIAATKDEKFRAFHMKTGKLLWETALPAGGYATPATYEVNGKQYIVIACGGGKMGTSSGDMYMAFSL